MTTQQTDALTDTFCMLVQAHQPRAGQAIDDYPQSERKGLLLLLAIATLPDAPDAPDAIEKGAILPFLREAVKGAEQYAILIPGEWFEMVGDGEADDREAAKFYGCGMRLQPRYGQNWVKLLGCDVEHSGDSASETEEIVAQLRHRLLAGDPEERGFRSFFERLRTQHESGPATRWGKGVARLRAVS